MPNIIMSDPRVQVDFTQLPELYALVNDGAVSSASATQLILQYPSQPNGFYDPDKPNDSYYGSAMLTEYAVLYGTIAYSAPGVPDLADSTITGFQLGYLESGAIYGISGFTLPGATLVADANGGNGTALLQTIFNSGTDTFDLFGTGSTVSDIGTTEADVYYPQAAADYATEVSFPEPQATVLLDGWSTADTLRGFTHLGFADTTLTFGYGDIDVSNTGAAHLSIGTLSAGDMLAIPFATRSLSLKVNPLITALPLNYVMMPDGTGGSTIFEYAGAVAGMVLAAASDGLIDPIAFDTVSVQQDAQAALDEVNAAVLAGITVPELLFSSAIPTLPAGKFGELKVLDGGNLTMPVGYDAALVQDNAATLQGGVSNGQVIVADASGLSFNAGLGAGSVFAGGGNNLISVYPGAGSQDIALGNGNDTVIALSGNDTVTAGAGRNMILLGGGTDSVVSTGADLIAGGAGAATITAAANAPTIFLGSGDTLFQGIGAQATVVGAGGADTLTSQGGGQLWLGSNSDLVTSTGADTLIGGTGAATVDATTGADFVFAGAGALDFMAGSGASTILGNANGTATLTGGSQGLIALSYGQLVATGGAGTDTIVAFAGSMSVTGGAGGALLKGSPAGHDRLTAGGGQATIFGGGAGDVLTAGSTAGDFILAGPGAETISGAGSAGANHFYGGTGADLFIDGAGTTAIQFGTGAATVMGASGLALYAAVDGRASQVTIEGFSASLSYLSLQNFPSGEATHALATAVFAGGNETLTLSDGTSITLAGFTQLGAGNFL